MKRKTSFTGTAEKFPGIGGWVYVPVPKKYTLRLKEQRLTWGMYPIIVTVGKTTWHTKLMTLKGGDFFVALKKSVRMKENIVIGSKITVVFVLS